MTIEINKSLPQIIVRIVWDIEPNESEDVILSISEDYTSEITKISLVNNISPLKNRFGEYNISNTEFVDVPEGLYTYKVYNDETIFTEGSLKIISDIKENIVEYKSDNTYISYEE